VPQLTVNAGQVDPYKSHAFRVRWDGAFIPGISRVGPLGWSLANADSDDPAGAEKPDRPRVPGVRYVPVQLERGRTHDDAF
jgi:hypothetical protein